MEYENWQQEGQDYTPYPAKRKKARWPWVVVVILALLAAGIGSLLHFLNFPAISIEETEHGVSIHIGTQPEAAPVQGTPSTEDYAPPTGFQGTGQTLTIGPSRPGAENYADAEGALSLQRIYEQVIGSVVTITTSSRGSSGLGTGIVMSPDGYIITNQHVIQNAAAIEVQLADDSIYQAALVGSDTVSDLAVLKIQAEALVPAQFGDSDQLRVGDTVVAIGNPLGTGLRGTMTDGIISGISRNISVGGRQMTLIQTNAALNNGNSGGPLINCYGQVIGINAVKLTDSYFNSGVEGLGFAIPIATAKPIVDALIEQGFVSGRPVIGVTVDALPDKARFYFRLPQGAYVTSVDPESDAAAQGIAAGDVITGFNGETVTSPEALSSYKSSYAAGDTVILTVYRSGMYYDVAVTLMAQGANT